MMTKLCLIRDNVKRFFAQNEKIVQHVVKFIVGILAMYVMTLNLSYMSAVSKWWIILVISAIGTILPWSAIVVMINGYILINFYAVSWEVAAVMACIYIVMFCTYYIFQPKNGILLVIMPIFLWLKLPLVPIVVTALIGTPAGMIPIAFGTIIYYVVMVVKDSSSVLALSENMEMTHKFSYMISAVFGNKEMWLTCVVFALTLSVIYFIRMRRVNYAREISIIMGMIFCTIAYLAGAILLNISVDIPALIIGGIITILIGAIASLSNMALDYSRTEYVQFEDDDYYYYVKAVPKITVTEPEFTVKRFEHKEADEVLKEAVSENTDISE